MSDMPLGNFFSSLTSATPPDDPPPELHEQMPAGSVPVEPKQTIPPPAQATAQGQPDTKDVEMLDTPADPAAVAQPATATPPAATQTAIPPAAALAAPGNAPSPVPARVGTPMRNSTTSGEPERTSSRAASAHPDTGFTMPSEAPAHGAPVRKYLNENVTGVLLEGMKLIAKDQ
jgi:COMPASS component SDC1